MSPVRKLPGHNRSGLSDDSDSQSSSHRNGKGNRNGNGYGYENGNGNGNGNGNQSQHLSVAERRQLAQEKVFEKQSDAEIQRLRQSYFNLQTKADDMRGNLQNINAAQLRDQLRQSNVLLKEVKDTGIATLDARLFNTTTETAANIVRSLNIGGGGFDLDEFLNRVKMEMGQARGPGLVNDEEDDSEIDSDDEVEGGADRRGRRGQVVLGDWEKIGWQAAALCRRVPGVEFMYGPLNVVHKKKTVVRRLKTNLRPEVRPDMIVPTGDKEKSDSTPTNVIEVQKTLKRLDPKRQGYNFFKLVINPKDFGQTVENMFYTSFLVRDGRAGIHVEEDGEVIIKAHDPDNIDIEGDLPKNQVVLEMDYETWQMAIEVYNITESAIPPRKKPAAITGSGWY